MARATRPFALFILLQLYSLATSASHGHGNTSAASYCRPDQAATLLQLKESFIFDYATTTLPSWQPGTNCCHWEGVGCDDGASRGGSNVTVLDLSGRGLYSYDCHAALFNLTSLRHLDLSMNDFGGSLIPAAGFERLSKLTYLNLSCSGLYGQVPITIGKLTRLISLDLSTKDTESYDMTYELSFFSSSNYLHLQQPSFETLVANLTNLRELYLDRVEISAKREGCFAGLGKVVPRLEVLSMAGCRLYGSIHSSMSSLRSLRVINLEDNYYISGPVPEFFADFLNLSVLRLRENNFSGLFPQTIFQLKDIRVIDVSGNDQLSGHLPEHSNGTSLEILNLYSSNFSGIKLSSFSNFLSLRELSFHVSSISVHPTDLLFKNANSLQNLHLSFARYSGELEPFFSWISGFKKLTSLQLSDCYSSKIMPLVIGNLTNLKSLKIIHCGFVGEIPPSIGNLINLTSLEILSCEFIGKIPPSIGNLIKLTSLRITECALSGTMPSSIGNLKALRSLEISETSLSGPITEDIGGLSKLTELVLADCRFSGRIPSTIVNLTRLIYVDLSGNVLGGEISPSLFTSPAIILLDLSDNQLSGPIQEFDTLYSHMAFISLAENQISGQIPSSFFELTTLLYMDLSSNNFTGLLQLSSLWKQRRLIALYLSDNRLSVLDGEVSKPTPLLLPKVMALGLASCNVTTIPRFLVHVNHIRLLDLSRNKIHGTIPQWIFSKWNDSLKQLNLSNNIFTHMQLSSYVLPYNKLEYFDLSYNRLQGQIPMPTLSSEVYSNEQFLDYSNNKFSSIMSNVTAYLHQTAYLKLSRNKISGHIPHSFCDSVNLEVLDMSYNNFSGFIPSCLIEDSHLVILNLRGNHIEGTLPYNVSEQCSLQTIDLHGNKIQGQLPRSLSNCADLEILDIGNNQIVDTFPSWLGMLSDLSVLILGSNQFYGPLSYSPRDRKSGKYFSKLQIIDIGSNNFSGNLDPRWFERLTSMMGKFNDTGNFLDHRVALIIPYYHDVVAITYKGQYMTFAKVLTTLTSIDFSNNKLEGDIPKSIGRLVSLHTLNMSHNAFTGRIPPQLGEMTQLESLDLSWNEIFGEIPEELTNLTFLGTLNLCNNKLNGRVPHSRQFATFENTSYEGNPGICGPPLSKPCGTSSNPYDAEVNISVNHLDIILFLFVGVGFGVGFATGILMKRGKFGEWFQIV